MKITLLTPALVAVLGLALASVPVTVQAQTSTNSPAEAAASPSPAKVSTKKATKTKPTQYAGSITAIDASSVTIANTTKTLTLAIAPTTTFLKDKKPATAADFAVGDKVTGSYTTDAAGTMTAHSLHKKTMKAAAPTPAAAPAAQ
jgi:hypothetical protein